MANANNGVSLTSSPTTLFADSGNGGTDTACTTFLVANRSGSSGNALVCVTGLHLSTEFFGIAPGNSVAFRHGSGGITKVVAKSDSTATIDCGVIAQI